ncbi:PQQ-dependent sugar dehydrogenase [Caldimonas tepidiphila]|uniref:PQQ-dependent sugar dehydrogenase n=1 Tax=Caldimonas tepidiphila TaxID=2315841 RepID=UPI000E5BEB40|nr:PQQ-dependent sugar dehydrogenase [Caldimonas tepidiphila]
MSLLPYLFPKSRCLPAAGAALLAAALLAGCGGGGGSDAPTTSQPTATLPEVRVHASGLESPWAMTWLPDGRMLVTEKPGRLRIVEADGSRVGAPIEGLPPVLAEGNGGLLDVALAPDFAGSRLVYWSYAEAGSGAEAALSGTAVARGRLSADARRLEDVQVIFRQQPKVDDPRHYGSRLVFARDGRLFVTLGDRYTRRDDAQDLSNHIGKIVRIEADGRVPADNPFVGRAGARPEIWSWGHRNVQGAALHPDTGELWASEHGPQGGDELNIVRASGNYGWPRVTSGCEYSTCAPIGSRENLPGMEPPLFDWMQTRIGPSGLAFVTSERYPQWRGQALLGGLASRSLWRLELRGNEVSGRASMFAERGERIRDVRQGPDGRLYLLTDAREGRILRLDP